MDFTVFMCMCNLITVIKKQILRNFPILRVFVSVDSNSNQYKQYKFESSVSELYGHVLLELSSSDAKNVHSTLAEHSLFLAEAECIACINMVSEYTAENRKREQKVSHLFTCRVNILEPLFFCLRFKCYHLNIPYFMIKPIFF